MPKINVALVFLFIYLLLIILSEMYFVIGYLEILTVNASFLLEDKLDIGGNKFLMMLHVSLFHLLKTQTFHLSASYLQQSTKV